MAILMKYDCIKKNIKTFRAKTLNFTNLWYANTLFLYNIIIQKQHQNNEEEGQKKAVSCQYLKISLSESYRVSKN